MTTNANSSPKPAANGGDPLHSVVPFDLVPGEPPVPITVWRTARTEQDTAGVIGARLADRIVAAYSRPWEAVIDLTTGHSLTAACATGARRHHPAWFTDVSSLIVGPPSTQPAGTGLGEANPPGGHADPEDSGIDAVDPAAWFGTDLTDPDLPPHRASTNGTAAGQVNLVVATWPLSGDGAAANRVRLAFLLAACRRLLRPGGCLVLVIQTADGTLAAPGNFSPMVDAAASAGLGYLQHIVAVTADTDGDRFTYHATADEIAALHDAQRAAPWQLHMRVHNDVLVFLALPGNEHTGGEARD